MTRPTVLKFGGELLEHPAHLRGVVSAVSAIAANGPVIVVHGGGKEIDRALQAAGIEKQQVDGLRITDDRTLEIVVSVLAGAVNTRLVAALNASGVAAVGLTGADGSIGAARPARPHQATDGRVVDLGRVGIPESSADTRLLDVLTGAGFVPVVACIGITDEGALLNVNADTLAGHLSARVAARQLIVAGTTPGVLSPSGDTLQALDADAIERLVGDRTATAGMIAKLRACEEALAGGVDEVVIADGRDPASLVAAADGRPPATATRLLWRTATARSS